ncbi:hypothetical protein Tco_0698495 [Tanacetum coccineum]
MHINSAGMPYDIFEMRGNVPRNSGNVSTIRVRESLLRKRLRKRFYSVVNLAHAASAMVNISKNYLPDNLSPYIYETVSNMNDLASDQTRSPTINILRQFRRTLPTATWGAIWPTVHLDLQMALLLSS